MGNIINNSNNIGTTTKPLVLNTSGKIYIRTGGSYYDWPFRDSNVTSKEMESSTEDLQNQITELQKQIEDLITRIEELENGNNTETSEEILETDTSNTSSTTDSNTE